MNTTAWPTLRWAGRSLIVVAAAFASACADHAPSGPDRPAALLDAASPGRSADLGTCSDLEAPAGSKLVYRTYARGVQIYRWNGTSWSFVAPLATLSADAEGKSTVGTHYAGPTWESNSGGTVVGTVAKRCTPNPNAIAWLSLAAVAQGQGVFHRVTFIQRLNTVGGNAPASPGSIVGEEAKIPYTTEYFFYRAP